MSAGKQFSSPCSSSGQQADSRQADMMLGWWGGWGEQHGAILDAGLHGWELQQAG